MLYQVTPRVKFNLKRRKAPSTTHSQMNRLVLNNRIKRDGGGTVTQFWRSSKIIPKPLHFLLCSSRNAAAVISSYKHEIPTCARYAHKTHISIAVSATNVC